MPELEYVDLIASGYEWECPECCLTNKEIECKEVVKCSRCGSEYQTEPPEHAYG